MLTADSETHPTLQTAAPPPVLTTAKEFLAALRRAGLLSEDQWTRAVERVGPARAARDAARVLTDAALLTPFQAERLLAGKSDGYVLGQYVILEPLSRGTVGRVYKARHRTMNRLVAIKVLAAEAARDPERRAAFQAEARDGARLAHPNVMTVLDSNQSGERLYIVMEYVEGVSADALVGRSPALTTAQACEIARQVALGLHHAHERGVTHGQLHPGCALVGRPGGAAAGDRAGRVEVKVTHFGLAGLAFQSPEDEGSPGGPDPLDYRAPELAEAGREPTPASDLYSLGGLLHALLSGAPPGQAPRPTLPAALERLLKSLLSADPARRPASAEAVAGRCAAFTDRDPMGGSFRLPGPAPFDPTNPSSGGFLSGLNATPPSRAPDASPTLDDGFPWADLAAQVTLENVPRPESTARAEPPPTQAGRAWTLFTPARLALAAALALASALALLAAGPHFWR